MIYYNKKINPIEKHYDKITEEIATVFIKSIFTEDYETKKYINLLPGIKKVIYNKPATIILWKDNTKTISICDKEDNYDELTGFSICVVKKFIGNSKFREIIEKYVY